MSRNIVIFSDGTGQRGGVLFDEPRSNIYKLYRATRCGPDTTIDPARQVTFYDPGIGTTAEGSGFLGTIRKWIYNTVSAALGLGLTGNIIDCYAALVRLYRPGDKVFLFGFSRGAYTVRCLAGVIGLCGIPTKDGDAGLRRDMANSKRIAREAVKKVYQHTPSRNRALESLSPRQRILLEQRLELARRFRQKYGAEHPTDPAMTNVYPHFIGVFDTVAALGSPVKILFGLLVFAALCFGAYWLFDPSHDLGEGALWVAGAVIGALAIALLANLATRIRSEIGLPGRSWWRPFHFIGMRLRFYDTTLNRNVMYARHALSIDESRAAFERVRWGKITDEPQRPEGQPKWLKQQWFAGVHSDIGGSYPEDESRLSDIALDWVLQPAIEAGLAYNPALLQLFPHPAGPQHDETRSLAFRWFGKKPRVIGPESTLHESVLARFREKEVLQYDVSGPYRPENLRKHGKLGEFYQS